jgi:hypothetical protein
MLVVLRSMTFTADRNECCRGSAISDKVNYVGAMYSPKSKMLNSATTNVFISARM